MKAKNAYQVTLVLVTLATLGVASIGTVRAAADKPTMEDVKKEAGEAAAAIKDYSVAQRDEALAKAKAVMDDLDAKIKELQTSIQRHWGKMDQAARRKAQVALDELESRRKRTAESYRALKRSSAGAWEQMKKGFSDSYADLHNAWQKAEKEFDSGK